MEGNQLEILLEEIYRLVEIVAEGVGENLRRIETLTAEIDKVKENQMRLEMLFRRLEGEVTKIRPALRERVFYKERLNV